MVIELSILANYLGVFSFFMDLSIITYNIYHHRHIEYYYIRSLKRISFDFNEEVYSRESAIFYLQQFEKMHNIFNSNSNRSLSILGKANLLLYKFEKSSTPTSYLYNELYDFHNYIINYNYARKYVYNDDCKKIKEVDRFCIISGIAIIAIFIISLFICMYFMFFK